MVEILCIVLLWLAPQQPFSKVLAPPLRYFFSDKVLHYPLHLWFLYHAMRHTHLIAATLIGAYMSGIACAMVGQLHTGERALMRAALVSGKVRYGRMVILWLVTWGIAAAVTEWAGAQGSNGPWVLWAGLGMLVGIQALLAYAVPAAVYNGANWWRALLQSIGEALRYPFSTLAIVLIASVPMITFAFFAQEGKVGHVMERVGPEIVFAFIAARLAIWMVADAILTVGVSFCWLGRRAPKPGAAA